MSFLKSKSILKHLVQIIDIERCIDKDRKIDRGLDIMLHNYCIFGRVVYRKTEKGQFLGY